MFVSYYFKYTKCFRSWETDDNILVAFEAMHQLKPRTKGKLSFIAIKLDMSKTYDHVEWPFHWGVMSKLWFDSR